MPKTSLEIAMSNLKEYSDNYLKASVKNSKVLVFCLNLKKKLNKKIFSIKIFEKFLENS